MANAQWLEGTEKYSEVVSVCFRAKHTVSVTIPVEDALRLLDEFRTKLASGDEVANSS